jgi:hypothetical protein
LRMGGILTFMSLLQLDSYTVTLKYNFKNICFFVGVIEHNHLAQ